MGNASGEKPQRLHFVRAVNFGSKVMLLGHNCSSPGEASNLSSRVTQHGYREIQFNHAAMFAEQRTGAAKHSLL